MVALMLVAVLVGVVVFFLRMQHAQYRRASEEARRSYSNGLDAAQLFVTRSYFSDKGSEQTKAELRALWDDMESVRFGVRRQFPETNPEA